MRIKIEKLIFGGYGLGHLKDGKPIFVRKSVPSDEIETEIIKDKKDYSESTIKKIIKPSTKRIKPPCPYFEECGGCEHQNISYPNQLNFKEEIFKDILEKAEIFCHSEAKLSAEESQSNSKILRSAQDDRAVLPIIAGSDQPLFYRNSIRFFFLSDDNNQISLARQHYQKDKGLVTIESCFLQSETSNRIISDLKKYINQNVDDKKSFWQLKIRHGKMTDEFMVEIVTSFEDLSDREGIVAVLKKISGVKSIYHTIAPGKSLKNLRRHLIYGSPIIHEKIGKYTFQISPESFFQTNSLGIKTLYDKIKEFANIKMGDKVLDLYCGTGTIGIYLSPLAKEVVGVESVSHAVRDANDNVRLNKIKNIRFVCSDVLKFLRTSAHGSNYSTIILDPPRAGLDSKIIKELSQLKFDRIIYVSCNPATFFRDIQLFKKHNINLTKLQTIDMFPQTHHLEVVGLLARN